MFNCLNANHLKGQLYQPQVKTVMKEKTSEVSQTIYVNLKVLQHEKTMETVFFLSIELMDFKLQLI